MSGPAYELVARCFAARTAAHMAHLTTGSYAQHVALGEFYDAVATSADEFFECWMSRYGKPEVSAFPTVRTPTGDPITQLVDLRTWIAAHRKECCEAHAEDDEGAETTNKDEAEHTELANLIDNTLAVIDRTIYKLRFLK